MRIADIVFRQGHLSEAALTEAVLGGERQDHLEQCEECARRALDLSRWLGDLRTEALDAADDAFPPEKLALQQAQILRRIEQLDEPARVIAFPAQSVSAPRTDAGRRVAPAWVGVAAAAGLVIGVVGGQMTARMAAPVAVTESPGQTQQAEPAPPTQPINASLLDYDWERHIPEALLVYDQLTPMLVQGQYADAR